MRDEDDKGVAADGFRVAARNKSSGAKLEKFGSEGRSEVKASGVTPSEWYRR